MEGKSPPICASVLAPLPPYLRLQVLRPFWGRNEVQKGSPKDLGLEGLLQVQVGYTGVPHYTPSLLFCSIPALVVIFNFVFLGFF